MTDLDGLASKATLQTNMNAKGHEKSSTGIRTKREDLIVNQMVN
jgi:hypothetical protein